MKASLIGNISVSIGHSYISEALFHLYELS